ncbi:MAG: T9SS type A sorting domain-containing protein, partial [Bacteroidales bacterium]
SDGKTEVTNRFRVNVINSMNTPPVLIKTISNKRVETGKTYTLDLASYFVDQENDPMTFEAWATNSDIADITVDGSVMSIYVKNPGESAIAIKAIDSNDGETLTSFVILAVGDAVSAVTSKVTIAPNPTNRISVVTADVVSDGEPVHCIVRDLSGKVVADQMMSNENGSSVATISVTGFQPGIYIVQIKQGDAVISTEKLVVTE